MTVEQKLKLGAWLTMSGTIVVLTEYDDVLALYQGFTVHPTRGVRYGSDGRLVSCTMPPSEDQTIDHEREVHKCLELRRELGETDGVCLVGVDWTTAGAMSSASEEMRPLSELYAEAVCVDCCLPEEACMCDDDDDDDEPQLKSKEPAVLRTYEILTPGGCYVTVEAELMVASGTSVDFYAGNRQVAFAVNPQYARERAYGVREEQQV